MPKVNPKVLIWARESSGLAVEEAATKLGLSASDRLVALEAGLRDPSRRQLVNMSAVYRRPLLTFYLPKPPSRGNKGEDFRTLPEGEMRGPEALLDALLRDVHARQGLIRSALEDTEEDEPLEFVGSAQMKDGVETLIKSMRDILEFSREDFRGEKSVADAFSALRSAVEKTGVFVILMGNLGTYQTDIDAHIFRGFALADKIAPFIVINEKDSRAAWSFTLLHELAHIFLGQTGISGYDGDADIEKFCDSVAAGFLLDHTELNEFRAQSRTSIDNLIARIGAFARDRNLSRKMIAYNLLRTGIIAPVKYRELSKAFDADRLAKIKPEEKDDGGPNYYVVRRHRIGPGLVSVVRRMIAGGALSTTKAGKVLGVKPTAVGRMIENNRAA